MFGSVSSPQGGPRSGLIPASAWPTNSSLFTNTSQAPEQTDVPKTLPGEQVSSSECPPSQELVTVKPEPGHTSMPLNPGVFGSGSMLFSSRLPRPSSIFSFGTTATQGALPGTLPKLGERGFISSPLRVEEVALPGTLPKLGERGFISSPPRMEEVDQTDAQTPDKMMNGYLRLLNSDATDLTRSFDFNASLQNEAALQEIKTTPLFSYAVREELTPQKMKALGSVDPVAFPQYGLLGVREQTLAYGNQDTQSETDVKKSLIFANMNAPWSSFICGSQGSGKSYTLSRLLENSLLKSSAAGLNPTPLAGLVFHYDRFTSNESTQICEAAYLCSSGIPVRVLVSPSNFHAMQLLYQNLPGLSADVTKPQVVPLYFRECQLSVTRMMTLMAVSDENSQALYMEVLYTVLRDMAREKQGRSGVDYLDFRGRLEKQGFDRQQNKMLGLRLQVLESFLADKEQTKETTAILDDFFTSAKGTLTIVDLSCPFVNEGDACALFAICLSIFMEHRGESGRVIALDEAHKFLTKTGEAEKLTDQLISIIRQQRHLATRTIIATQEPTLSPQLLDLCNVSIIHRFNSPAWYKMLSEHLASVRLTDKHQEDLFETILSLKIGQALVFCPTALLDIENKTVVSMRHRFIKMKVRAAISTDGGKSILSSDKTPTLTHRTQTTGTMIKPFTRPVVVRPQRHNAKGAANGTYNNSNPTPSAYQPGLNQDQTSSNAVVQPVVGTANALTHCNRQSSSMPASWSITPVSGQPTDTQIIGALHSRTAAWLNNNSSFIDFQAIRNDVAIALHLGPQYMSTEPGKTLSRQAIKAGAHNFMRVHSIKKINGI